MSTTTTITSLLNSLHTHLQSQTLLLPTLHAQLGLPPTALTDELAVLQQQLTQCIEQQIDLRRKQVDEWMERCCEMEDECLRYGRALGNHVKTTGSSVGEIRKEQVLPRRFEVLSEYQEKLRQLYHTKLEQLTSLTSRLMAISHTLSPDFYAQDILEPTPAEDEDEDDPDSHRDVTPERFAKLEKELVRGKGEVSKRLAQLSATMVQIDWLYTELGIEPPTPDDVPSTSSSTLGVPTMTRPASSCSSCSSHSTITDPFLSSSVTTPTPAARSKAFPPLPALLLTMPDEPHEAEESMYQRIFSQFVARMEEASDEEVASSVGLEGVEPTPGLLAWAEATRGALEDVKRRREAHIQTMYDQLEALWRRLAVSEADMDTFVEMQRGSTEGTVRAYEEELERMLELKRESMGAFVENARMEITRLWDELMVGEEERADFVPFFDDEHTEELLSLHEDEIRRLKEDRRAKGTLLASIRKYFDICEDEKELAAAASDQSRLLGRGPRDPGRLLREEKMRKRVTKEKPRLEQDLLASIPGWEAETGRIFLVHGQSMLQILMESMSAADKENNKRSKSRAGSIPPRTKTPSNTHPTSTGSYMPMQGSSQSGKGGAVIPAVRPGSSLGSSHGADGPRDRDRASSPTKIPNKTSATTMSSLPRPVPVAMPVPRSGTAYHAPGHGRAPSAHGYGHHAGRTVSGIATSAYRAYGAPAVNSQAAARKASRARRESFKPRPSVDENWLGGAGPGGAGLGNSVVEGGRRWGGFPRGNVKEEDDY